MLTRFLLVLAALGLGAGIASSQSQPAADLKLPAACRGKATESLDLLEKRKERLEQKLAAARAAKPERADAKKLTKTQAALLDALFQIQCYQMRQLPAEQTAAAEPTPTDRAPSDRGRKRRAVAPPSAPGGEAEL